MAKVILWIIGIVVGLPIAFVTFNVFLIYVVYPAQHSWSVKRMDVKNEQLWEESTARVATVEAELGTADGVVTLETEVVCYEGNFASAWNLKDGGPKTGTAPTSIGFETLQAEFPTGAILDIELSHLCKEALRADKEELPLKLEFSHMNIVVPVRPKKPDVRQYDLVGREGPMYCPFYRQNSSGKKFLDTDAGWVGFPHIVALDTRPLRAVATLSEMGSSETPSIRSGFTRRWGTDYRKSSWYAEKKCWSDELGRCDDAITQYCGKRHN